MTLRFYVVLDHHGTKGHFDLLILKVEPLWIGRVVVERTIEVIVFIRSKLLE